MERLDEIIDQIHQTFETRTKVRDQALKQASYLTRYCANAIRAVHRGEGDAAHEKIKEAEQLVESLSVNAEEHTTGIINNRENA